MHDQYQVYGTSTGRSATEIAEDRKEQLASERAAQQADKDRRLIQQRAMDTPPATRISLWESRHGLAMPRDPNHPLLDVIAQATDLDRAQVLAEHGRRALLRAGNRS